MLAHDDYSNRSSNKKKRASRPSLVISVSARTLSKATAKTSRRLGNAPAAGQGKTKEDNSRRQPGKQRRGDANRTPINLLWPGPGDGEGSTCKTERLQLVAIEGAMV